MGSQESRTQLCNEQYRIATFAFYQGGQCSQMTVFPPTCGGLMLL